MNFSRPIRWAITVCVASWAVRADDAPEKSAALPEALVMQDGRRVDSRAMWEDERRPELVRLIQQEMYGFLPPRPAVPDFRVERIDAAALGGKATLTEVALHVGPPEMPPIHLMVVVPNRTPRQAPVLLAINYFGNHTLLRDPRVRLSEAWMPERGEGVVDHRSTEASRGTWAEIWRIEDIIDRGYALATFYNGDVDPDSPDLRGLQKFFPVADPASRCGSIAAWAWGLQRAVDYLVTVPEVDGGRIVVTGHSRLGKAALLAAALDDRIACAIPHQAGAGGSAPSRATVALGKSFNTLDTGTTKRPETVADLNEKFPHWFNERFKSYNGRAEALPFDQNALVALCAPRPVLFTNGRSDTWINPAGQFEVLRAAAPVYRLLRAGDFAAEALPADAAPILGTLGYALRPGGHSLKPEDWKLFMDFADRQLGPPACPRVPRWSVHEWAFRAHCEAGNPFAEASLRAEFTAPSGRKIAVEGFYDGDDVWRVRFAPMEEGAWTVHFLGEGVAIDESGAFDCVAPQGRGFIGIHPENPHAFAWADGTAFFPMGDTCYGLSDDSPITPERRAAYLETRRRQRFNFVRMSVTHNASRGEKEPGYWPWGGTPARPDPDRFNPAFFRRFDAVVREVGAAGMNIELLLLNFYQKPFTDPMLWTAAREERWLRYLMARYAACSHVFLWTVANEYETHPDGRYRLDFPGDVDWAKATARLIKAHDPWRHPVTVHPVVSASRKGESPRAAFDRPWRIGEFFGVDDALDIISQQTGGLGEGLTWDASLQCWTGDPTDLVASLNADRRYGKPVLNTEHGYEFLRGQPTSRQQVHHTDKVRRSAWRIVCAGGYFAAGFHGTLGHSDVWNRIDPGNHYAFELRDEGAADQMAILHRFFSALPFWKMEPVGGTPGDVVALADPGKVAVAYFPHGGEAAVPVAGSGERWNVKWLNPRTGEETPAVTVLPDKNGTVTLKAPDANDWAAALTR